MAEKKMSQETDEIKEKGGAKENENSKSTSDGQKTKTDQKAKERDDKGNQSGDKNFEKSEEKTEVSENPQEQESERYMRLMAEFQNFKKRAAKEKTDIHAYANENLMNELLPVLDNFERALETDSKENEGYAKGMEMIFEQMKTALANHGLKEIEALGETFDPNKHSAVMNEDSDEYESGKVCKVMQKGYELNGRVIRPAMVSVSK